LSFFGFVEVIVVLADFMVYDNCFTI